MNQGRAKPSPEPPICRGAAAIPWIPPPCQAAGKGGESGPGEGQPPPPNPRLPQRGRLPMDTSPGQLPPRERGGNVSERIKLSPEPSDSRGAAASRGIPPLPDPRPQKMPAPRRSTRLRARQADDRLAALVALPNGERGSARQSRQSVAAGVAGPRAADAVTGQAHQSLRSGSPPCEAAEQRRHSCRLEQQCPPRARRTASLRARVSAAGSHRIPPFLAPGPRPRDGPPRRRTRRGARAARPVGQSHAGAPFADARLAVRHR